MFGLSGSSGERGDSEGRKRSTRIWCQRVESIRIRRLPNDPVPESCWFVNSFQKIFLQPFSGWQQWCWFWLRSVATAAREGMGPRSGHKSIKGTKHKVETEASEKRIKKQIKKQHHGHQGNRDCRRRDGSAAHRWTGIGRCPE